MPARGRGRCWGPSLSLCREYSSQQALRAQPQVKKNKFSISAKIFDHWEERWPLFWSGDLFGEWAHGPEMALGARGWYLGPNQRRHRNWAGHALLFFFFGSYMLSQYSSEIRETQCPTLEGSHPGGGSTWGKHRQLLTERRRGPWGQKGRMGGCLGRLSHMTEKYHFNSVSDGEC